MLALCARYQLRAVGPAMNSSQRRTAWDDGAPGRSPTSATASHPSRSSRSLTARHHTLPGGEASSGSRTPRCACQRMNDNAARRNGRCRGARPVGPRYVRTRRARRAAGSSRAAATCASAQASAPAGCLVAGPGSLPAMSKRLPLPTATIQLAVAAGPTGAVVAATEERGHAVPEARDRAAELADERDQRILRVLEGRAVVGGSLGGVGPHAGARVLAPARVVASQHPRVAAVVDPPLELRRPHHGERVRGVLKQEQLEDAVAHVRRTQVLLALGTERGDVEVVELAPAG